ncbi:unnamed protein product [Dibothriocephalus latus]|uniref:Transcription and mRNA export factor ENY2 n=1 Tax=Dibothriocephalus latus TaxID=60516 RepID=A0A3P7QYB8_DIBLA|nr:unnamed protein product [Dibothriocephalus latus]
MAAKREEVRRKLNDLLFRTGEREKIRARVEENLKKSNWDEKMKVICREYVKEKGVDMVSLDDIVMGVTAAARNAVPKEVKLDALQRVTQFMEKHNIDVE